MNILKFNAKNNEINIRNCTMTKIKNIHIKISKTNYYLPLWISYIIKNKVKIIIFKEDIYNKNIPFIENVKRAL